MCLLRRRCSSPAAHCCTATSNFNQLHAATAAPCCTDAARIGGHQRPSVMVFSPTTPFVGCVGCRGACRIVPGAVAETSGTGTVHTRFELSRGFESHPHRHNARKNWLETAIWGWTPTTRPNRCPNNGPCSSLPLGSDRVSRPSRVQLPNGGAPIRH